MSRAGCLMENTLAEFAEGKLARGDVDRAEEHLADCALCRATLADITRAVLPSIEAMALATTVHVDSTSGSKAAAVPSLAEGELVGRYRIVRHLGAGAMGAVYLAHDPDLDRKVAVKLLHQAGGMGELRTRLLREAQAMARLSHPEVITVHDVGTFREQLFVAMEFVEGGTLRQWLASRPRGWREIVGVLVRAGRGLAGAHAAGLVHRDFKPDNVLVGDDGRVRVTDFGLARAVLDATRAGEGHAADAVAVDTRLTRTGTIVGTPAYMAPEQLRGAPADARSDIFSFCVSMYEALYGGRPFEGSSLHELRQSVCSGRVRAPAGASDVPSRLYRVLAVGLRTAPEDRYDSMNALFDAIASVQRGRRRGWIAGVALAGVAAAAVAALASERTAHAPPSVAEMAPSPRFASSDTAAATTASAVDTTTTPASSAVTWPPASVSATTTIHPPPFRRATAGKTESPPPPVASASPAASISISANEPEPRFGKNRAPILK
jgi:serine/threonine protein kinase